MSLRTPKAPPSPACRVLPCGRPMPSDEGPRNVTDLREQLAQMMARLDRYVAEKKLNRSDARGKILETIVFEARHFRPHDLLAHLQKRFPRVGKATLYRNLPVLVESGVIQEGPTAPGGQILYELADAEHHDHIVCLDCQKIFEFHDDAIEKRQEATAQKLGFSVTGHRHVVYASCKYRSQKN